MELELAGVELTGVLLTGELEGVDQPN